MPRRRTRQLPQLAPLAHVPAFWRHKLTPAQRWAVVGAPGFIVAGLLVTTLHRLVYALPMWWIVWCLIAGGAGLLIAAAGPFAPVLRGDLERFDESRTWLLSVAGMYGCALALAVALGRAATLHVDAPLGPLSPAARSVLTWIALATGGFCAGAIATGVATVAMFTRQWVDGRRSRAWNERGRELVGADAARSAADRIEWLANDGALPTPRESMRRETVHLLRIASRAASSAILRSALDGPPGELRESLRTASACVEAGLVDIEAALYDRERMLPAIRQLRRLANALEGGYWSNAARALGDEAWRRALVRRARARQLAYDIPALAMLAGLVWMTLLGTFHTLFGAAAVLKARVAFSALFAFQTLVMARRQGWISTAGYSTFASILRAVLRAVGIHSLAGSDALEVRRPTDDEHDARTSDPRRRGK